MPEIENNGTSCDSGVGTAFSRSYSTGCFLKSAIHAEFKIKTSDRSSAEVGPTAGGVILNRRQKNRSIHKNGRSF